MNIFKTKLFDNSLSIIERAYYLLIFIVLLTACFNLFYNLDRVSINSWDEARHGVSAYEMIKRNNYIVNTYSYKNDYWNLKPPISYWAIILGYKLFGFTPLGLRFISALTALVTIVSISLFTLYKNGKLASLISTIVLTTTYPFIVEHSARSGDADSIFLFFFVLSMISLQLMERNIKWLYLSALSFSMAFLTKSWHSGNIFIIMLLYLIQNKLFYRLHKRDKYKLFLCSSLPIAVWGIFRFTQDGFAFFLNMIGYDLFSRTATTLEGHVGGIFFYIESLKTFNFYWFIVFISVILASLVLLKPNSISESNKKYILHITLWIAVPFVLFTLAKTKIAWYILPIYPAMSISIGALSSNLLKQKNRNLLVQAMISFLLIISIYKSEESIIKSIITPQAEPAQELLKTLRDMPQYRGKKIYIHHFEQSYWLCSEFYADLLPVDGGLIGFLEDTSEGALFFSTKDRKDIPEEKIKNLKVLAENEAAYILTK